jgi:uncharacterized membrane protein YhaH (DUF805 family)
MKYYYLNSEKKPVGPQTVEEMKVLKQSGVINDDTLAAVSGDSKWKPLAELMNDCSTWNNQVEGDMNVATSNQESTEELSLWACFTRAFKLYATFKGRATRKEFWGFYLFYAIISYAISMITDMLTKLLMPETLDAAMERAQGASDDLALAMRVVVDYLSNPVFLTISIISTVIGLFLFIPFLSVSVRRLHDTGSGATGVALGVIGIVWMYTMVGLFVYTAVTSPENALSIMAPFLCSILFLFIVSIYLFVKMLMPSKAGENQYGPQPRN